jgi:hypothetical protein
MNIGPGERLCRAISELAVAANPVVLIRRRRCHGWLQQGTTSAPFSPQARRYTVRVNPKSARVRVLMSARNRRAKVRGDMRALRASCSIGRSSPRFCSLSSVSSAISAISAKESAQTTLAGSLDGLRLAAVALGRHHHSTGDDVGHRGSAILATDPSSLYA